MESTNLKASMFKKQPIYSQVRSISKDKESSPSVEREIIVVDDEVVSGDTGIVSKVLESKEYEKAKAKAMKKVRSEEIKLQKTCSLDTSPKGKNTRSYNNALHQKFLQTVYDLFFILIIYGLFIFVYFMKPKIRYFTCDESDIFYPFLPDTVPAWAITIYSISVPVLTITFVEAINTKIFCCQKHEKKLRRTCFIFLFHGISLYFLGLGINMLLTEIGKKEIGRLRPHFMSICKPDFSKFNCTTQTETGSVYNQIGTGGDFCSGDLAAITEARLSFPSGHSSASWYSMVFVIIYLEARFIYLQMRYLKIFLQMMAFIAAFFTMLSRVSDYYHRPTDVIAGSVLGIIVGLITTLGVGREIWTEYMRKNELNDSKYEAEQSK